MKPVKAKKIVVVVKKTVMVVKKTFTTNGREKPIRATYMRNKNNKEDEEEEAERTYQSSKRKDIQNSVTYAFRIRVLKRIPKLLI